MPKVKLNTTRLSYNEFKEQLKKPSQPERLVEQLKRFESKHKMTSTIFYEKYQSRQLPDRHDFSVWAAIYKVYSRIQAPGGGRS